MPLGLCLAPNGSVPTVEFSMLPTTHWWVLLIAMIAGLMGTYLGAWQENEKVKLAGYVFAAFSILGFLFVGRSRSFESQEPGDLAFQEAYMQAFENFTYWLLLSIPLMIVAVAVYKRYGAEAGKIASSAFSEYLSFLCICWMLFALALNNCT